MSETTWYSAVASGPWWWVQEIRPGVGVTQNIRVPSKEMAERIARLLTEEDAAKERDDRKLRAILAMEAFAVNHSNDCPLPSFPPELRAWAAAAFAGILPAADLDALEAAYRAAMEAEK